MDQKDDVGAIAVDAAEMEEEAWLDSPAELNKLPRLKVEDDEKAVLELLARKRGTAAAVVDNSSDGDKECNAAAATSLTTQIESAVPLAAALKKEEM